MRMRRAACDDQEMQPSAARRVPRLHRRANDRLVAGVARGLADHLGLDVVVVRILFVALAAAGGAGIVMYALFWVFAPLAPDDGGTDAAESRELATLLALGSLALGMLLLVSGLVAGVRPELVVPLFVVGFGVVLLWRLADDAQRERLRVATARRRGSAWARAGAGLLLVLAGGAAILVGPVDIRSTAGGLAAILVLAAGLVLISGPWWVRMARELSAERSGRIREQERAEVAAHVHDSVLHTLTLIQRSVENPRDVARLARAQERELRGWLYRGSPPAASSVRSALERVAAEVEDAHGVAVEVVVVGDCDVDERIAAMVQAAREAMVNSAKYAGRGPVSVYAEVEPEQVTVFVRDRGEGFDPETIPADRLGVRQSVVARMTRNGGSALVRSGAGDGTEVQLEMPRSRW